MCVIEGIITCGHWPTEFCDSSLAVEVFVEFVAVAPPAPVACVSAPSAPAHTTIG